MTVLADAHVTGRKVVRLPPRTRGNPSLPGPIPLLRMMKGQQGARQRREIISSLFYPSLSFSSSLSRPVHKTRRRDSRPPGRCPRIQCLPFKKPERVYVEHTHTHANTHTHNIQARPSPVTPGAHFHALTFLLTASYLTVSLQGPQACLSVSSLGFHVSVIDAPWQRMPVKKLPKKRH